MIIESKKNTYILPSDFVPAGGTLLNLQYNNSNVDISDNPKTVTANGTEVYIDGKYGELLSAREFTGTQSDTFQLSTEIPIYTISGWFKYSNTQLGSQVNQNTICSAFNNLESPTVSTLGIGVRISGNNNLVVTYRENISGVFRGFYIPNMTPDKWVYVAALFDSVNKTCKLIINGKDVTSQRIPIAEDFNAISPFPASVDVSVGYCGNPQSLTNFDVYKVKMRNYWMSNEETKDEFKKYTDPNSVYLYTDQSIAQPVGITTVNTQQGKIYHGNNSADEILVDNVENVENYIAGKNYEIRLDEAITITRLICDNSKLIGNLGNVMKLVNLNRLFANSNEFSGSIPSSIGNLTSMDILYLNNNLLSGSIPAEIGNLTLLNQLLLNNNSLSGSIPTEIGNLTLLTFLYLHTNQFTGSIPSSIGNLTNLTRLYLYSTDVSGSIPTEIGNLVNIQRLWLYNNNLSGTIPSGIQLMTNANFIFLHLNQFTGAELDAFIVNEWNIRAIRGAKSCSIQIQGNASGISADSVARIEGTGLYIGDGLVQAGCTVTYTPA